MKRKQKGFTLIELLVVIAIIAILSIVVVLTLNPAEMLRRSRDSNRTSDLGVMKTAIALYLADVSTTSMGSAAVCYMQPSIATTVFEFADGVVANTILTPTTTSNCAKWFLTAASVTQVSSRSVSAGWVPIDLTKISSGAPIGQWPVDPQPGPGVSASGVSNAGHFYSYVTATLNNAYKVSAKMESAAYSASGTSDIESTDGGSNSNMFETGSNLAL